MNLILWRHAEAEAGTDDLARVLTEKGRKQAKRAARWLDAHLHDAPQIWVSEAVRSRQTAEALRRPCRVVAEINPDAQAERLLPLLDRLPESGYETVIWVGHEPWIGRLCAFLLQGSFVAEQHFPVKKSALWWFKLAAAANGRQSARLYAVLPPALMRRP